MMSKNSAGPSSSVTRYWRSNRTSWTPCSACEPRRKQTTSLTSNKQQTVSMQQQGGKQVIIIAPTQPDTVYVPYYDPGWSMVRGPIRPIRPTISGRRAISRADYCRRPRVWRRLCARRWAAAAMLGRRLQLGWQQHQHQPQHQQRQVGNRVAATTGRTILHTDRAYAITIPTSRKIWRQPRRRPKPDGFPRQRRQQYCSRAATRQPRGGTAGNQGRSRWRYGNVPPAIGRRRRSSSQTRRRRRPGGGGGNPCQPRRRPTTHSAISAQEEWPTWTRAAAPPAWAAAAPAVAAVVVRRRRRGRCVAVAAAAADVDPISTEARHRLTRTARQRSWLLSLRLQWRTQGLCRGHGAGGASDYAGCGRAGSDGYLRVFYDKLGLKFQTYDEWISSGAHTATTHVAH